MTTSSRHARRCATGAVLAATCLAAPAQADLSAGRPVTPPGTTINGFDIATSPTGGRVALLYGADAGGGSGQRLLFARLGEGRNLGPVRRLEERRSASGTRRVTTFGGRVAVSADGSAVAAWIARGREAGRDQLRVAIAPRGRGFGPARTLVRARGRSGYVPYLEIGGIVAGTRGRAVVTWSAGQPGKAVMQAAVRTRGLGFGAPQTLGPVGPATATAPALVQAPSGAIAAAWTRRADDRTMARTATLRPGARRFGATRQISGADVAGNVGVTSGPGGAAVYWSDDRRQAGTLIRLRIARLRRDGTLAAPQTIATVDPGVQAHEVAGLQLGFPLAGPVAAWQVFNDISEAGDGRKDQTHVDTAVSRDGAFGAPEVRSTPGAPAELPVVGALADRTLVAWPEFSGGAWHLRLAVRPADGDWAPAQTFADGNGSIAIAASRSSALVLWQPFAPLIEQRVLQLAVYRP